MVWLPDLISFADETLGHEIGGPFWFRQVVGYVQSCIHEWDCRKAADISYYLDKEL